MTEIYFNIYICNSVAVYAIFSVFLARKHTEKSIAYKYVSINYINCTLPNRTPKTKPTKQPSTHSAQFVRFETHCILSIPYLGIYLYLQRKAAAFCVLLIVRCRCRRHCRYRTLFCLYNRVYFFETNFNVLPADDFVVFFPHFTYFFILSNCFHTS